MSTWLNRGRLRRPGRGLKTEEKSVETNSTNRLTHRNSDTPTEASAVQCFRQRPF